MADDLFARYQREYGLTLDAEQCLACRQIEGKVLLLAVPGSGKTTVMIARLGYMTRALGINPSSILAVTYSVAGAKEMKSRYERLFGDADVEFRTINGFCAAMIHRYEQVKGRKAFTLIDKEGEVTRILKELMISLGSYPSEQELRDVRTAITFARNRMLSDDEIKEEILLESRDFLPIYQAYRDYKREHRLMDYDDQLCYGYQILKTCPEVNRVYADRFQYLCVDEAQDTSLIQHKILETMANRCGNLFMVGDEDQSIYGFRAAYPKALLDFEHDHPGATIMHISKNYRSTGKIVALSDRFIKANTERLAVGKNMRTDNEDGEAPLKVKLSDLRLLPDYVRKICSENINGTTALLFRLNDSMLPIIDMLNEKDIPFRSKGSDTLFFTHTTVIDVLNILEFATEPYNTELFSKIYYKLNLSISKSELQKILQYNIGEGILPIVEYIASAPYIKEFKRNRAKKLASELIKIASSDTYEAIKTIFFETGYGKYCEYRGVDSTKRNVLLAISFKHRSREAFYKRLAELEGAVKRGSVSEHGLILSTIHSAKGMEFDRVILCDCKNGILPSDELPNGKNIITDEEMHLLEEERRLFYVGTTRAKKKLELITWENEFGKPVYGFDFVDVFLYGEKKQPKLTVVTPHDPPKQKEKPKLSDSEIKTIAESYSVGTAIRHTTFGDGVIMSADKGFIVVRFARFQIPKKLEILTCIENNLIREI